MRYLIINADDFEFDNGTVDAAVDGFRNGLITSVSVMAGMPGFAVKMAKHSINFGYDLALDNACRIEVECCGQCFSTDDQKEGMKAFLEKRKPTFTGR